MSSTGKTLPVGWNEAGGPDQHVGGVLNEVSLVQAPVGDGVEGAARLPRQKFSQASPEEHIHYSPPTAPHPQL